MKGIMEYTQKKFTGKLGKMIEKSCLVRRGEGSREIWEKGRSVIYYKNVGVIKETKVQW